MDFLALCEDMDKNTGEHKILRAPMSYPGGKNKLAPKIIEYLPYYGKYVEPFGGSAAVLLSRRKDKLEVFNDRYAGVVAFYRCLRDKNKTDQLKNLLNLTVHSREEFQWCKESWHKDQLSDVERAARWYYMTMYSFSRLGRNFGRSTTCTARLPSIRDIVPQFDEIHERFKYVQVENQDWYDCLIEYDSPETVFYLDPPYLATSKGAYKEDMTHDDHVTLIKTIDSLDGFVALSGYDNDLYNSLDWDDKIEWEVSSTMKSYSYSGKNNKKQLEGLENREKKQEILWIKEAR